MMVMVMRGGVVVVCVLLAVLLVLLPAQPHGPLTGRVLLPGPAEWGSVLPRGSTGSTCANGMGAARGRLAVWTGSDGCRKSMLVRGQLQWFT